MSEILKNVSESLRAVVGSLKDRSTAAVIVAAGSSTRMGGDVPKQFLDVGGLPVVVRALRAYEESDYVDRIVVVVRPGDRERYEEFRDKYRLTKMTDIVEGRPTRQGSVLAGVEALGESVAYVAIADGARPLTTPEMIDSVCLAAYRYGAATAAFPACDTIKSADEHGFIEETVDRSKVWHATTPQIFALNVYRAAAYSALDEGFEATDDNSLVERIGHRVKLVDCGKNNIKITSPEDIPVAEALLRLRDEEDE